jgi:hypothetical protein
MKVAILGNMNNNGFSLMRYLRDLGVDAHLLLYSNDGKGSLEHFKPENDTFEIDKWKAYIHQTDIMNGPHHVISISLQKVFFILYNLRNKLLGRELRLSPLTTTNLTNTLQSYNKVVTSGYGPAILFRANRTATIFSPYAIGIEGVNRMYAPRAASILKRALFEYGRYLQINALRLTEHIVNSEMGITKTTLHKNGLHFKTLSMPMLYVCQNYANSSGHINVDKLGAKIEECDFSIMMHCRLAWNDIICKTNNVRSKNNHWVIISFKALLNAKPSLNAKMIILEYGPDVENTRNLIDELGLKESVIWVPKTSRKNIMWLLQKVSVGVGEFIETPNTMWGGTGWEVLASGKPLLQGFFFESEEFEQMMNHPEPPLLKVRNQEDVYKHLIDMADHPEKAKEIGLASQKWFNTYNGLNLAKQWLNLIQN